MESLTIPSTIKLYPVSVGEVSHRETKTIVFVHWVYTGDDEAWQNLYNAFESYIFERYESTLVPANVAVELTIYHLFAKCLEGVVDREDVGRFLRDGATYSHQINILLPVLARFIDAPSLPKHIYQTLNELRKYRNQLSHDGELDHMLERNEAAEYLCAAVFGVHYLRLIEPLLLGKLTPSSDCE